MSHLFEIESALFIKPYIFILASEAGRGFLSSLVYSPAQFHGKESYIASPATPITPLPEHSSGATSNSPLQLQKQCTLKIPTPQNSFLTWWFLPLSHSPAPTLATAPGSQLCGCSLRRLTGDLAASSDHQGRSCPRAR